MAQIVLGALEGDGWELVPGWFTLRDVGMSVRVISPFDGQYRQIATQVYGEIDVPSKDPVLQLEAYAAYANHFSFRSNLVEGTSVDVNRLIGLFLPAVTDAPSLVLTGLDLGIEFVQPKTQYQFNAAITSDWQFRFGGTSVLAVQYAAFALDNYSNNGEPGGWFDGVINILGAETEFRYVVPGEFSVDTRIPHFEVDTQEIAAQLAGGWAAPDWFPHFTFPDTHISISRRIDAGEPTYSFHLDAQPSVGEISLDVFRYQSQWGFAAAIRLKGGKISSFPGLSGLTFFDDFLTMKDLVMAIATMQAPNYQLRTPKPRHPRARLRTTGLRRRHASLRNTAGTRPGIYIQGGLILRDDSHQGMLRRFLGIDLTAELDLSLYLGINPAQNAEIQISYAMKIANTLDLTCIFGGQIQGGVFSLYLRGQIDVVVQGKPLQFMVEMRFVANGGYLAGSMLGTIEYWVFKISNVGVVVGINFEGIPSLGLAATIDVANFNSSIAVFFDANIPTNSMLAGAVSDITLQDVVDALVGALTEPVPEDIGGILEHIGISGSRPFDLPGSLGNALDEQDIKAVAAAFAMHGVTIPSGSDQVLLTVNTPDQVWFLTDLTKMLHYELRRTDASNIQCKFEAQLYLVPAPAGVNIGAVFFPNGYRIHGVIEVLFLRTEVDIEISTNKGIAADVKVDPIVIGNSNLFSLTGFDGQGGPTLSLSTFTQPDQTNPDWRPPHFFVSGRLNLLGIEVSAILVSITQSGLLFELHGEYFTGTRYDIAAHFTGLKDFGAAGDAFIGIDREADLGPLGKIHFKFGVEGKVSVSYDGKAASASFSATFSFMDHDFTIDPQSLDTDAKSLLTLAETAFAAAAAEIREFLLEDAERWLNWVRSGVIRGVEDVESVLSELFGWLEPQIWGDGGEVITTIREVLRRTEAGKVTVDPADADPALRAWGEAMLEQQVLAAAQAAQQLLGHDNIDRFDASLMQSFKTVYAQSQVVPWAIRPQTVLPSITSLGYDFRDFHQVVDVRELRVSVQTNVDFDTVNSVVVTLHYPGLPAGVAGFKFDVDNRQHVFVAQWDPDQGESYDLGYRVSFRSPTQPEFESPRQSRSERMVVISPPDIGIRHVTFDASTVEWSTQVSRIEAEFFYLNSSGEEPLTVNFALTAAEPTELIESHFKLPATANYTYSLLWMMSDGSRHRVPSRTSNADTQYLGNPFTPYTVAIISQGILDGAKDVLRILLKVSAVSQQTGELQSATIELNAGQPYAEFTIESLDPSTQLVTYQGTIVRTTGPSNIPLTTTSNPSVLVGNVAPWFDVRIDPSLLPWLDGLLQVTVDVYTRNAAGVLQTSGFTFRPDTPEAHWGYFQTADVRRHTWQATYFYADLTSVSTGAVESSSAMITLPAKPPSTP